MDGLRWILLLIGAVLLLAVYLLGQKKRPRLPPDTVEPSTDIDPQAERPPALSANALDDALPVESVREQVRELSHTVRDEARERAQEQGREKPDARKPGAKRAAQQTPEHFLVVVHVAAHRGQLFDGQDLLAALEQAGLVFGEMDIFHRMVKSQGRSRTLFSVANMIEPGTLKPQELIGAQTPGISLFLQLPTAKDNLTAYNDMLACVHSLVSALDGEVLDETRSAFTQQAVEHLRDQIQEFTLKTQWQPLQ